MKLKTAVGFQLLGWSRVSSDSDIASFTLTLDDGQDFVLLVYVQSDGTVCDFI